MDSAGQPSHYRTGIEILVCSALPAFRRLTSAPARIIGVDRGTLKVGQKADINVIDLDTLSECMPEIVNDFRNAPRFIQKARQRTLYVRSF